MTKKSNNKSVRTSSRRASRSKSGSKRVARTTKTTATKQMPSSPVTTSVRKVKPVSYDSTRTIGPVAVQVLTRLNDSPMTANQISAIHPRARKALASVVERGIVRKHKTATGSVFQVDKKFRDIVERLSGVLATVQRVSGSMAPVKVGFVVTGVRSRGVRSSVKTEKSSGEHSTSRSTKRTR